MNMTINPHPNRKGQDDFGSDVPTVHLRTYLRTQSCAAVAASARKVQMLTHYVMRVHTEG